ncbi:MAG: hypothetical protein ACLTBR_02890 [Anaerostipes sp.]|uniref:hypothetical protein n=1 Tax=Anaerostipes sp. TaxID=1872530 RepID=UPI003992FDD3
MGRELRRVSMDFDYPLNQVWYGYYFQFSICIGEGDDMKCEECREMARVKNIPMTTYKCPDFDKYLGEPLGKLKELLSPPVGEGYQLWATTAGDAPISPVFGTLDELCEWCEKKCNCFCRY